MIAPLPFSPPVDLWRLSNAHCAIDVCPTLGGRITSSRLLPENHELLWRNASVPLAPCAPGSAYDPVFFGGIDELLPCDLPETIDGIPCPDHGELWTLPLTATQQDADRLLLHGVLPQFGLDYHRALWLEPDAATLVSDYRITNRTKQTRHFLWKLHAALAVQPGDIIDCPARWGRPADPAYTSCPSLEPFPWPMAQGVDKSLIPAINGNCEFLYLYKLSAGRLGWRRPGSGLFFTYHFDRRIFPYAWLFQSFGGFDGHYTSILEPCTAMPISVPPGRGTEPVHRARPGSGTGHDRQDDRRPYV